LSFKYIVGIISLRNPQASMRIEVYSVNWC